MLAAPRSRGQHRDGRGEAPRAAAASERPGGVGMGRATSLKMPHGQVTSFPGGRPGVSHAVQSQQGAPDGSAN